MDLLGVVAEVHQRRAERLVGDLEVSAAGELLEFHQGEVGLDAGGVAIHEQADGAGGGDDGGLGVAVAVALAEGEARSQHSRAACEQSARGQRVVVGELRRVDADGLDVERFVIAERLARLRRCARRRTRRGGGCG